MRAVRHMINVLTRPVSVSYPWTPTLSERVGGRTVLITGASSGIGRRLAERVAEAGARAIVTARRADELDDVVREIAVRGGIAHAVPGDLSTSDGADAVATEVLERYGAPDTLVLNAGRSIMRSLADSEHRLHDYERTVAINYLGGVGLVLRLLPGMRARGSGHIVHSSSIGVLGNLPDFSAYVGSKAAMDAVLRIAGIESRADGVRVTNVHLPLVTTDMIAPSDWSQYASLTLEEGVDMVVDALRRRSREVNNPLGILYRDSYRVLPGIVSRVQNDYYRWYSGRGRSPEGQVEAVAGPLR
ncbi:SDR family NAD(P)-dependent oxidoreductase [Mycobacteroides salmoniphilum]|uniref:SDR family NAD(P)-dependent oxidoreductase n=1 Tax=Mycobacteroides salmoniphilum TaxID=404941 RepID=UPI000993BA03|nr:SDR family NAD(P)-dependent oxidoreductase [Mycobacteroides salmoniphilum]QCH24468.1 Fatty acyl-CoA reductase [Mycobacteroides salmoniphilum]